MIRFEHIRKEYPDITPIKDLSGVIEDGQTVSIIGPSGTGKSTLIRMVNGLEKPTSGKIFFDDLEITAPDTNMKDVRKDIGMIFQQFNLFNHMSVIKNIVVPQMDILGKSEKEAEKTAKMLLERVGLSNFANKMPRDLSGGQKQRVAIARTLAMNPKVILLDEPTSALDPNMVLEVKSLIQSLKDDNRIMAIVTHDMKFADEISDKVFYLDEGGIYEEGSPEQIFHNPQRLRTKIFIEHLKELMFIVDSNDIDFNSGIKKISEFAEPNKLPEDFVKNMISVLDKLVVSKLSKTGENRIIKYSAIYEAKDNVVRYKIKYTGSKFNPFEDESYSSAMSEIIDNCSYRYMGTSEYNNSLKFTSKI